MNNETTKQKVIVFSPMYSTQKATNHFTKLIRKWFKADGRYEVESIIVNGDNDNELIFSFMLLSDYLDKFKTENTNE
jgi:hypothetical protein